VRSIAEGGLITCSFLNTFNDSLRPTDVCDGDYQGAGVRGGGNSYTPRRPERAAAASGCNQRAIAAQQQQQLSRSFRHSHYSSDAQQQLTILSSLLRRVMNYYYSAAVCSLILFSYLQCHCQGLKQTLAFICFYIESSILIRCNLFITIAYKVH